MKSANFFIKPLNFSQVWYILYGKGVVGTVFRCDEVNSIKHNPRYFVQLLSVRYVYRVFIAVGRTHLAHLNWRDLSVD